MTVPPTAPGRKDDAKKRRFSLLPLKAVEQVVDVLEYGAVKYGEGNWKRVPDAKARYWDAAVRHLIAWRLGQQKDPETGFNHLAHAMCSLLFGLAFDEGYVESGGENRDPLAGLDLGNSQYVQELKRQLKEAKHDPR